MRGAGRVGIVTVAGQRDPAQTKEHRMPMITGAARRSPPALAVIAGLAIAALLAGTLGALAAGSGTVDAPPRTAFVARSDVAADALAAGPVAGRFGAVLFTTPSSVLADEARTGLAAFRPELVVIAGGTAAISQDVELSILQATGLPADRVVRAAGANRHHTAALLAQLIEAYNPAFLPVDATAVDSTHLGGHPAADYARTAAVTGYASCHYSAFLPAVDAGSSYRLYEGGGPSGTPTTIRAGTEVGDHELWCAVDLPHGAQVVRLSALVFDNSPLSEVAACRLHRAPARLGSAPESVLATTGGTGEAAQPGLVELTTTSIGDPVVDLGNYHYAVACTHGYLTEGVTGIAGATVEYVLTTVPTRTP
jgi:hypothetical protein